MHNTSLVKLAGVAFAFGTRKILRNLTFDIKQDEFFSVIGPSGCGKSTLLSLIGMHRQPTEGAINLQAELGLWGSTRSIATVFQQDLLFPHLTVYDNIAYGLRIRKMPSQEIKKKAEDLAMLFEITDLLHRKCSEISGGQAQRVAIARALSSAPKLVLLDEPLASVDHNLRIALRRQLRKIQRSTNSTFIYVTHNQEEAFSISDRIAVLGSEGNLEALGTPSEIFSEPHTYFTATFIGMQNTFKICSSTMIDGLYVVETSGGFQLKSLDNPIGQHVGIHAKYISIHRECAGEITPHLSTSVIRTTVRQVEFFGPYYLIELVTDAGSTLYSEIQTNPPKLDEKVSICIEPQHIKSF